MPRENNLFNGKSKIDKTAEVFLFILPYTVIYMINHDLVQATIQLL